MNEQVKKANTLLVTRLIPDTGLYEETVIPVTAIVKANMDATNTFTYLRVSLEGRAFNWHVKETPQQINQMANGEPIGV